MSVRATGGGEVTVNSFTDFTQTNPRITVLGDGGWVVTYTAEGTDGSGFAIFQQRFDAEGNPAGPETQVNSTATGDQDNSSVVALADGGWVVCWNSFDGDLNGVFQQRFDAFGEPVGGEELVNVLSEGEQGTPSISALADGGWVVAFHSYALDPMSAGISAVLFSPDGTNIGELFVTLGLSDSHFNPSVAGLGDGGWVMTWMVEDAGQFDVLQTRFDASGAEIGTASVVNSFATNDQANPVVTALFDGGWVVIWESTFQDGTLRTIYQQRYDAYGSPVGGEVRVSPAAMSSEEDPQVTALADGGWIVSWEEADASSIGLFQQRFDAAGNPVGSATLINATQTGAQFGAALAALPDGSWIAAWVDNATGTNPNIVQRIFAPDIVGTTGADILAGTRWNEILIGNAGNDTLDGGGGNDLLIGGLGNDSYIVNSSGDQIRELSGQGADTVRAALSYSLGSAAVENLILGGTADINGNGNALVNTITGNTGDNTVNGNGGGDWIDGRAGHDILNGGLGNDVLIGGTGNDRLAGGAGRDTANYATAAGAITVNLGLIAAQNTGGAGSDTLIDVENLIGSAFNDSLTGDHLDNMIEGGAGNDAMSAGLGVDTASYGAASAGVTVGLGIGGAQNTIGAGIDTLSGFENLVGSIFDDILAGNSLANVIEGGAGNDQIDGAGGIDTATYATSGAAVQVDLALLGAQNTGGAGIDTLTSLENLIGTAFADELRGSTAANQLHGGAGNDLLVGLGGADRLIGGFGADQLFGGGGADRFIFDDGDSGRNSQTIDRIADFNQGAGDLIVLNQMDADRTAEDDQDFTFIGDAAFTGLAGELRFSIEAGSTYIQGDTDGDMIPDFYIRADGMVFLDAADFVL